MRHTLWMVMVLGSVFLWGCGGGSETKTADAPAQGTLAVIDTGTLKTLLQGDSAPLVLDVRTPGEYAQGHIEPSLNIPVYALQERLGELDPYRGQTVVVVCERGGRSAQAADLLSAEGFSILDYSEGMSGWREQ